MLKANDIEYTDKQYDYNPQFIKSILDGKKEIQNGDFIEVKNPSNIWESIK